jgi:hypothetical protein
MAYRGYTKPTDPLRDIREYLKRQQKWNVSLEGYEYRNVNTPYVLLKYSGGECANGDNIPLDLFECTISITLFDKCTDELQILDKVDELYECIKKMRTEHFLPPCSISFSHGEVEQDIDSWVFSVEFTG